MASPMCSCRSLALPLPTFTATSSPLFASLFNVKTATTSAGDASDTGDFDALSEQTPTKPQLPAFQPSPDADLISKLLLDHHNPFHAMESSLQLYGISLSSQLLHQTLLRLNHFSKIALSFFSWSVSHRHNPNFTPGVVDLIIDILGRARQFDVTWQLIVELQTLNLTPNSSTFLVLIRRPIAAGLTRQTIRAFDDMPCFVESQKEFEGFLLF